MGEGKEEAEAILSDLSPSPAMTTRVYVGGLSGSVTAADMEKTFSPLGRVGRVEFVRTNGRSFAFMDFQPNSDKSLAKLFTTYNGCIWKGGRLRVEKAKENYLDRLTREWAEDAELKSSTLTDLDPNRSVDSSERSKCTTQEKMQLRIFFPKLMKVKPLPFKGTGKHKYSFQRIEIPSLPVHFCDCEEHFGPLEAAIQKHLSFLNSNTGGMNEEELNIMNSVMNKIIQKEANVNAADRGISLATDDNILDHSMYDTRFDEREPAQGTDMDNLVTNFGMEGSIGTFDLMLAKGWETVSVDQDLQESRLGKNELYSDGFTRKKQISQKRQKTGLVSASEMLSKEACRFQSGEGKIPSIVPGNEKSSETQSQEGKGFTIETQMKNSTVDQSTKGPSWAQKSSWRELIGDSGHSTFCISQILPRADSLQPEVLNDAVLVNSNTVGKEKAQYDGDRSKPSEVQPTILAAKAVTLNHEETFGKGHGIPADLEGGQNETPTRKHNQQGKTTVSAVGIGEVCTFIRCADSEREWTKARTALSGYLKKKKKKSNENNAPKSSKWAAKF